jgi:hypothetical protein
LINCQRDHITKVERFDGFLARSALLEPCALR